MALLSRSKVTKVASLFEHVPEAFVRSHRATGCWSRRSPEQDGLERTGNPVAETMRAVPWPLLARGPQLCDPWLLRSPATPPSHTKYALDKETPGTAHQYSTALWKVISYTALYFPKHFILTFILQPNTKDLFLYKACITSACFFLQENVPINKSLDEKRKCAVS